MIRWLLSTVSDGDDLRRPRRARRLEHLRGLARGDARAPTGGTSTSSAALMSYWVYQHLGNLRPDDARRRRAARSGSRRPTTASRSCASSPRGGRPRDATAAAGATAATWAHAPRGDRLARRAGAGGGQALDARRGRSGTGSRSTPPAASTTSCSPPRCRGCSAAGCTTLEAWSEAVAGGAWGPAAAQRRRERCARRSTWSTGRRSRTRSSGSPSSSGRSARASAASRRPRSSPSPATCTTPTSSRSPSRAARVFESAVCQAVCSPYRNPLDASERRVDPGR